MLKKIEETEIDLLAQRGCGMYCEYGFISGSTGQIVIQGNAGWFLVSENEYFEKKEPFFVALKPQLLLAIGGLPETQEEKLAKELNVTVACATDILYLRSRSRWTQALETELIRLHKNNQPPNMCEFGSTAETQAQLYWSAMNQ